MIDEYARLIDVGGLRLSEAPCAKTLTEWMNDPELTPILHHFLETTASPFRATEVSAVDSSTVSQMSSAHARWVEYEGDERERADWIKCHAVIGAETSVVMGVIFSGTVGTGTHDINFLKPLVNHAMKTFDLRHVLADKAYLSGEVLGLAPRVGNQSGHSWSRRDGTPRPRASIWRFVKTTSSGSTTLSSTSKKRSASA